MAKTQCKTKKASVSGNLPGTLYVMADTGTKSNFPVKPNRSPGRLSRQVLNLPQPKQDKYNGNFSGKTREFYRHIHMPIKYMYL
jgi:hypothetical protein